MFYERYSCPNENCEMHLAEPLEITQIVADILERKNL